VGSGPITRHRRIVPFRERWGWLDVALATFEGYREHRSARNATVIAYFGFLSIFPLMLVFTTVLGLVLRDRPDLQDRLVDSVLAQLPIIGETVSNNPSQLSGSFVVLVVGLLGALWAGMKAFVGVFGAFDDVAEVPIDDRSNIVIVRGRALAAIVVIGGAIIGTSTIATLASVARFPVLGRIGLVLGVAAINAVVVALGYRWLCSRRASWREVMPGSIVAGLLFAVLQLFGTTIIGRSIANASPVYGTFATVIALVFWLSLHAQIAILGAEMNRVLVTRGRGAAPAADG
jgi:membrane protein